MEGRKNSASSFFLLDVSSSEATAIRARRSRRPKIQFQRADNKKHDRDISKEIGETKLPQIPLVGKVML